MCKNELPSYTTRSSVSEQRQRRDETQEGMKVEETLVTPDLVQFQEPQPTTPKPVVQTMKYSQPHSKPNRSTKLVLETKDRPGDTLGAYGLTVDEVLMSGKSPLADIDLRVRTRIPSASSFFVFPTKI